jgi:ATP-binding cassette, subfamily B, multidrug efflux pump
MIVKKPEMLDEMNGKPFDPKVANRLLPYLRSNLIRLSISLILVFVSAGVSLYTPQLLGKLVDKALIPKDLSLLYQFTILYFGLEVFRLAAVYIQSYQLQKIGQSVMQSIRTDLFGRIMRMPISFFDQNPSGKLVTRVTNDTMNLSELFSSGFVMLLSDVILIVGVIGAMLALHLKLGLLVISVFPLMVMAMFYFSGKLRFAFRSTREVLAKLNGFFAEQVSGMPVVQLMEREKYERKNFENISIDYRERQFQGVYLYSLFHPTITILGGASVAIALWFGPAYVGNSEIPVGTFVTFLAYAQVLYQPVRNITDRYNIFLAAMSSAERIFSLLDMPEEPGLRESAREVSVNREGLGSLKFEKVTFHYPVKDEPKRQPALQEMSFEIKEGETVALVGHTGAGKTTITALLFRFYDPSSGRIELNGKDLRSFSKRELRERIGFVQQEVFLFSGSLRENLSLLREGVSDEEILKACNSTGFSKILAKLPSGLDTVLDERGTNFSLGERQILAFTRVYIQRPDLLVLDEATSSVDRESEILLQRATEELMKNRTCLVIAHRLETVRHADRIFVLEKGKLIESGNHETLLKLDGVYANFVDLQGSQGTLETSH